MNLDESYIVFSPNNPTRFKHIIRSTLGVSSRESIGEYLGNGARKKEKRSVRIVIDKTLNKVSKWSSSCMSQSAKLILINSILVAMSAHIMLVYLLSNGVSKALTSILVAFWWASMKGVNLCTGRERKSLLKPKECEDSV